MRVAVYAVECNGSWEIWLSLELAVDLLWWNGGRRGSLDWTGGQSGVIGNVEWDGEKLERKESLDWTGEQSGVRGNVEWDGEKSERRESLDWTRGQSGVMGNVEWDGEKSDRKEISNRYVRQVDRLVLLFPSLPLGWGVKLRERFIPSPAMRRWKRREWGRYVADSLKNELREEEKAGGHRVEEWLTEELWRDCGSDGKGNGLKDYKNSWRDGLFIPHKDSLNGGMNWTGLAAAADRLAEALSGRSLLQNEIEALVAERLPELAEHWRAAAQLAHLQGRLQIEAAVGVMGAGGNKGTGEKGGGIVNAEHSWRVKQGPCGEANYDRRGRDGKAVKKIVDMDVDARRGIDERGGRGAGTRRMLIGRLLHAAALRLPLLRLFRRGAAARRARAPRCLRCGSAPTGRTACAACGLAGCAYCEACLALGRSRACALLLRSAPLPAVRCTAGVAPTVVARRWGLSAAQAAAAAAALGFLAERRERSAARGPGRFLLWAVTGAGKTEITFPLLEAALRAGGRALIATPRRDVVLELAPRLAKAFPADIPAVLYGGSEDRWSRSSITLATTHQLMRFHQAFDLVIIDELDAYPYHNDPMLAYAAEQVCKPAGSFIYLSATPPLELQRLARSGRLPHARVPVRFHGHPLPVPTYVHMSPLQRCLRRGKLPRSLLRTLQISLERKAQIFVFVPRIAHIPGLLQLLRRIFPGVPMEGTSSKDAARAEKVLEFRSCALNLLVTTTILERGVTVPRSDVFILDADSRLFDEAALVQMAGRAGRSKDDPNGRVVFASAEWSRSQRGAISQIRSMNTIARRQGYLKER